MEEKKNKNVPVGMERGNEGPTTSTSVKRHQERFCTSVSQALSDLCFGGVYSCGSRRAGGL